MRKLLFICVLLLGIGYTYGQETQQEFEQRIVNVIGFENIVSVAPNVSPSGVYPATPLCQSNNANGENFVIFEWNGNYWYGMYNQFGMYAEFPVTEEFAKRYCKGVTLADI